MVHVPYAGSPNAVTALIRSDVQAACLPAIAVTPQLASGTVKIFSRFRRRCGRRFCPMFRH